MNRRPGNAILLQAPDVSRGSGGRLRGFSLLELVVSLVIASLVFLAIGSAILLATHALPGADSPSSGAIQAAQALDQVAAEVENALYIIERSATTLAFTVPDRNGDGLPERIRYAWSGVPGDPLTRQYNGGPASPLAEKVEMFNAACYFCSITETYAGAGVEDAADSLLVSNDMTSGLSGTDIKFDNWVAQHFRPSLPGGTMGWRPTRVKFMARINQFLGLTKVQLRPVDVNLKPTGTVLQEQSMWGFTLPASYGWQEFTFSGLDRRAAGGSIALVLQYGSGGRSATVQTGDGDGLLTSNDSGGSWSYNSNKALRSQLYGKVTRPGPTQYAVSHYLTGVHLAMQVGVTGRKVETTSGTLNQPELLWGLWETSFDTNPTLADTNGDGAGDWVVHGGGALNPASLINGVWQTTGAALDTSPACDFDYVTIADLVFRSLVAGTGSAVFTINADRSGSVCVPLTAVLQLETDGTQSLTVAKRKSDGSTETLIRVRGLPGGLVTVRLLIDPAADSVSVTAEGVHVGTYGYGVPATTCNDRFASVSSNGGAAEFSYVRVRILDRVSG